MVEAGLDIAVDSCTNASQRRLVAPGYSGIIQIYVVLQHLFFFENNSQYVELALHQCTSLKCRECNKKFHAQSYTSHKQLFRSLVQHHKAAHT